MNERGISIFIDAEHSYMQPAICSLVLYMQSKYNRRNRLTVFNTQQTYLKVAQNYFPTRRFLYPYFVGRRGFSSEKFRNRSIIPIRLCNQSSSRRLHGVRTRARQTPASSRSHSRYVREYDRLVSPRRQRHDGESGRWRGSSHGCFSE